MLVISGAINQSRDNIHAPLVTVVHNTPLLLVRPLLKYCRGFRVSCLRWVLVRLSFVFSDNKCTFVHDFLSTISEKAHSNV